MVPWHDHHSTNDIATLGSVPNMRVYFPSDRHQTRQLMLALLADQKPAYIRVGRNPVEDVYSEKDCPFVMDQATVVHEGSDLTIIASGEMVYPAYKAALTLAKEGISCRVLDMFCVKPLDTAAVLKAPVNPSRHRHRRTRRDRWPRRDGQPVAVSPATADPRGQLVPARRASHCRQI